ncbi:ribosome maturation protein RimP [Escherichia coli]|uniref:Ribosome maturation protein RimP n=1 Tax=Escherichia coli TaxID=562 RepID=A0A377C4D7_ECOLX|nr:ribosome maturation protein RimP [Escherichia coli]
MSWGWAVHIRAKINRDDYCAVEALGFELVGIEFIRGRTSTCASILIVKMASMLMIVLM